MPGAPASAVGPDVTRSGVDLPRPTRVRPITSGDPPSPLPPSHRGGAAGERPATRDGQGEAAEPGTLRVHADPNRLRDESDHGPAVRGRAGIRRRDTLHRA